MLTFVSLSPRTLFRWVLVLCFVGSSYFVSLGPRTSFRCVLVPCFVGSSYFVSSCFVFEKGGVASRGL